ncbi:MAG: c-type cytochrome [Pirellulales bacterium]
MEKPAISGVVRLLTTGVAMTLLSVGCSRQPDLAYTPREELEKLPQKHQEQIAKYLEAYFGTPSNPRYLLPAPEEAAPEEAAPEEAASESGETNGGGESTAAEPPSKIKLKDHPDWNRSVLKLGAAVYTTQCAPCHGTTGDGQGPAGKYLNPPPRDYRLGRFKFNSTPRGYKPRREDLVRIIRRGAKGTSMPSFRWLPDDELEAVIGYVMVLASRGEMELQMMREAENELEEADDFPEETAAAFATQLHESWVEAASQVVNPLTTEPLKTPETVALGAQAFVQLNCYKCHGNDGRGNKAFNVGKDDWGRTAFAADLTSGMLHGGRRPIDIYRRIFSGINGTPMPAFNTPDETRGETLEQRSQTIWHLVHFVTSIVDGEPIPLDLIEETIKSLPTPGAETPATETPPATESPAAEKPAAEPPATDPAEKPSEPKPAEEKPAEEKPADAKPAETPSDKPSEPATQKPEEKPADKPDDKPAAEKPADAKPTEEKPAAEKPAADGASGSKADQNSSGGES